MRRILLVVLGFGVISGFGSAFAHARHMRHHGGCDGERWGQRWDRRGEVNQAPAPVQTVVVPQAAPAPAPMPYAAPAPQIFVITVPSGGAAAQPIAPVVVTTPATAPAAAQ
ncbi:MAG: hypothetical protein ACO1OB_04485 [Archangium sp.]